MAFFPANSLTLNPLELFFIGALGILRPFLFAAIAAPLSTSNPTGGVNKSSLAVSFFSLITELFAAPNFATKSKVSSKNSSEEILIFASRSSLSRFSLPNEIINMKPLILM